MALVLNEFRVAPCEECGMGASSHALERFTLRLDSLLRPWLRPLDALVFRIAPLTNALIDLVGPLFARVLFRLGLAVKVTGPDSHSSETAQALWAEAERRGIEMYEVRPLGLPRRHFIARHGRKSIAFEGLPRTVRIQRSISWIDDKAEVKKRFQAAGFPVPRGGWAAKEGEAVRIFAELQKPAIVKPREGSGGRHTAVHIDSEEELSKAFRSALLIAPAAIIEEELLGPVFRATLIDGRLAAVLRRDPPRVIGDGRSTIRELVDAENTNPLRRGPIFAEIKLDSQAAKLELARQGLSPDDIPAAAQEVLLHFKVNWGVGGTSRDATEETHPDNIKLFEDIGSYLGEDIAGIDFMIQDIGRSWREQLRCGVIECNSLPLIGNHHFPYDGPVKNVAGDIWTMVFPMSRRDT